MVYNYSLYSIPAMWVMSISQHMYAASLTKSSNDMNDFSNVAPREFLEHVRSQEKQTPLVKKYLRTEASSLNSFENLAFFGVAVLAGNMAGVPAADLNVLTGAYLASRAVFSLLYINTTSESLSYLRSLTFVSGVGCCFTMIIKAGNAMNRSVL